MAEKLTSFVWRNSARDQIVLLIVTLATFPVIWLTLELPKIIINDAISGSGFPREIMGLEFEQIPYLVLLCGLYLLAIAINNTVKFIQNLQRGILGERMLRRMRFQLFQRVMGRPLRRLRETSPGELVQLISAELAPIGDFIGAIIVTPVAQGGSFLVYLSFIIVQNPLIGAAALALYPVQAFVIPKLQAKVVEMIRARLANIRAMAREINESIDGATEVRTLRARRWHMAIVSRQLHDNYLIRRRIFMLKFLIKFVNNVANHVTPFFIFLIGGWFVIEGELDVGALTAVLIAYKDLAAPWKELLRYYQDFSDMSARYESVMENFEEDGEPAPLMAEAPVGSDALSLRGAVVQGFSQPVSCRAPKDALVAVLDEDAATRTALLQALSGLVDQSETCWSAGTPILYRAAAYVPPDPRIFTGTLRTNLVQGLRFRPVSQAEGEEREARRREAELTGSTSDDIEDEWIDPAEAGYADHADVEKRILSLASSLGFEDDLYMVGLGSRIDAESSPGLAEAVLALRRTLAEDPETAEMRVDYVDVWEPDRYNPNGTVGENLFFALPLDPASRWPDLASDKEIRRALQEAGIEDLLVDIGLDVCEALVTLFESVTGDSDLFKRYAMFPRSETPHIEAILRKARTRGQGKLARKERTRMIEIAFDYCSARFRLNVMRGSDRTDALLEARGRLRETMESDARVRLFDPDAHMPAFSISENILFGPVKMDRRDSWGPLRARVDDMVREIGLREAILQAGVDQPVGDEGTALNAQQRRKVGLARGLLKNPGALVIDQIAASDTVADEALRRLLRKELGKGTLVYGTSQESAAVHADHVIRVDHAGRVMEGPPPGPVDEAEEAG